jgi:cytochrome c556
MRREVLLGLLLTGCLMQAQAQADENAAEYREGIMEAVGGHMQAIVKIAKGEVAHNDHLGVLASNMVGLATIAQDIFPEGSDVGDSDALPEIWSEPEAFEERLQAFQDAAGNFDAVVASGDMSGFGKALEGLGQACKSCHDDFKADD